MIEEVANAIVARLKGRTAFAGWKVDHFPDAPARYPFAAAQQQLLVNYEGSKDGDDQVDALMTDRSPQWQVTIIVRSLRGPTGASSAIDAVRTALHGWTPPQGGSPFMPLSDGFKSESDGVWMLGVLFTHTLPSVANPDEGNYPAYTTTELDPQ